MPPDQVRQMFFGDGEEPIFLDTGSQRYPVFEMGWPDGVGGRRLLGTPSSPAQEGTPSHLPQRFHPGT